MRHSPLAGLSLVLAFAALPALAGAQQPAGKKAEPPKADQAKAQPAKTDSTRIEVKAETKATVETNAGDVAPATPTQVLTAATEVTATAAALQGAQVTSVRLVNVADVVDAATATALDLAVAKNADALAKLRAALDATPAAKSALAAANVPADRVIGASVAGGVVTVFHKAP